MRLLVTGATGFIGSTLAFEARRRGYEVMAAGQLNSPVEVQRQSHLQAAGVQVITGALQDPQFTRSLAAGCDVVIHLAAAQHEANVPDSYFRAVNVEGTQNLLNAARTVGVRRFVYGSTIGIYGSARDGVLSEDSAPRPDNIYGVTKLEAEQAVRAAHAPDFATTIVRISETYGPGDARLLKLFRGINKGAFMLIGNGMNVRQLIHVHDLVNGLLLAAEHPRAAGETFVLAGTEVLSTRDMVTQIAEALQRRVPKGHLPMLPFMVGAVVMETLLRPLGIQPPLHRRRLDFFRKSFLFSVEKARTLLGFDPRKTFREGARETADWYRQTGQL
jgi:dihydroflavonol-4-reductase